MPVFRFAIYFAALVACAVAAFPAWAPAGADAPPPPAYPSPSAGFIACERAALLRHHAAPPRVASRD